MAMPIVKRGAFVEFSTDYHFDYTLGGPFARYGICIENTPADSAKIVVRTIDGVEMAHHIHAVSWAGWIPENLEKIWIEEFCADFPNDWDEE